MEIEKIELYSKRVINLVMLIRSGGDSFEADKGVVNMPPQYIEYDKFTLKSAERTVTVYYELRKGVFTCLTDYENKNSNITICTNDETFIRHNKELSILPKDKINDIEEYLSKLIFANFGGGDKHDHRCH